MSVAGSAFPAVLLAVSALFFSMIAIYLRAKAIETNYTTVPQWPSAFTEDGAPCDPAARIELVERLAIVAEPWCLDALREASQEERHPHVRKALDAAWKTLRKGAAKAI